MERLVTAGNDDLVGKGMKGKMGPRRRKPAIPRERPKNEQCWACGEKVWSQASHLFVCSKMQVEGEDLGEKFKEEWDKAEQALWEQAMREKG